MIHITCRLTAKNRDQLEPCTVIEYGLPLPFYYDTGALVKLHFNPVGSTRSNKFKLRKEMCRYDIRKYSFCYRVVNVWNGCRIMWLRLIPSKVGWNWINAGPIKSLFLNSELIGTGGLPVCM